MIENGELPLQTRITVLDRTLIKDSISQRWQSASFCGYNPEKGRFYRRSHVLALLGNPLTSDQIFLSDEGKNFYLGSLQEDKYSYPLKGENIRPTSFWYPQGDEPTCTTWSFVNALAALEMSPSEVLVRRLLNRTMRYNQRNPDYGLPIDTLNSMVAGTDYPPITTDIFTLNQFDLLNYARMVKSVVDNDGSLIESVGGSYYNLKGDNEAHAVAITGYKVTSEGDVKVQVVDSNVGSLMLPADFVFNSRCGKTMAISKKC